MTEWLVIALAFAILLTTIRLLQEIDDGGS